MCNFGLISFPVMDYASDGNLKPIGMDLLRECPPLSLYWLPEVLKRQNIETIILDLIAPGREMHDADLQLFLDCDLIGISSTSMAWPTAIRGAKFIQTHLPEKRIVFGGPHPTLFDAYILRLFPNSFVIRGEAENALPKLIESLRRGTDLSNVPNLSYKDGGNVIRTAQAPKLSRAMLSKLPPPNYKDLPTGVYQGLSIESSRGCPFDCAFCSTNYRRSYRPLAPDRFISNLTSIASDVAKSKLNMIHIVDDEFTMNQARAIAIADGLERDAIDVKLTFDARANDLHNVELVEKIAPFTYKFLVGAECGYDDGLLKIGKGATTSGLRLAAKTLYKAGLSHKAHFSFIVGLPWEGVEEVQQTISFAVDLAASYGVKVLVQWYLQIPGSELWAKSRDIGKVSALFYDEFGYFTNPYLFFSAVNISPDQIWEVSDSVLTVKWALRLQHKQSQPIAYNVPGAVARWFPREYREGYRTLSVRPETLRVI